MLYELICLVPSADAALYHQPYPKIYHILVDILNLNLFITFYLLDKS